MSETAPARASGPGFAHGRQLDIAAVAERIDVRAVTVRGYLRTGHIPPPDGRLGRSPWWWETTIEEWEATRPGQGARVDIRKAASDEG